ncbi:GIY-YIG nuclease family protein [Prosthecobacter sp.]|uniref:GIY-YIG nuclease family protein n=1 Tax=Prosthecobacter sp. TaxID=1965333 RepID=UPI003BB044B7
MGITQNLERRSEDLRTSNPHPIEALKTWKYSPWGLVGKIEKLLHRHFEPYHHRLEWFKLPEAEVARLCASKNLFRNHFSAVANIEISIA